MFSPYMVVSIVNFIFHCVYVYVDDSIIFYDAIVVDGAIVVDDEFVIDMSLLSMPLC